MKLWLIVSVAKARTAKSPGKKGPNAFTLNLNLNSTLDTWKDIVLSQLDGRTIRRAEIVKGTERLMVTFKHLVPLVREDGVHRARTHRCYCRTESIQWFVRETDKLLWTGCPSTPIVCDVILYGIDFKFTRIVLACINITGIVSGLAIWPSDDKRQVVLRRLQLVTMVGNKDFILRSCVTKGQNTENPNRNTEGRRIKISRESKVDG